MQTFFFNLIFKLSESTVCFCKGNTLLQWVGQKFQALLPAVRKEITFANCKRTVELTAKMQYWETKEQLPCGSKRKYLCKVTY